MKKGKGYKGKVEFKTKKPKQIAAVIHSGSHSLKT